MNTKLLFLGFSLLLLVLSFWVEEDAFDSQLYDIYYVISWGSLFRVMSLLCCLVGGVYFLRNRQVNRQ